MKKRKTYEVSVINKTYSKTYSDQTKFYTSDTALELNFQLKEVEYDFDSAEIILLNVDDRSLVTRPVVKSAEGFTYELEDDIVAHYGEWKGQLKFNEGGEIYVSSPVSFRIENDLNNDRPPQLTDIRDWETLRQSAKDLIVEMGEAVTNEAVRVEAEKQREETVANIEARQTSVENQFNALNQELTKKDVISAPEIIAARNGETNLKSRLDKEHQEVTAQLAQKITQGVGGVTDADLSQEVKEQMTGGSVAVVGKQMLLTENFVPKQITPNLTDFVLEKETDVVTSEINVLTDFERKDGIFVNPLDGQETSNAGYTTFTIPLSDEISIFHAFLNTAILGYSPASYYDKDNVFISGYQPVLNSKSEQVTYKSYSGIFYDKPVNAKMIKISVALSRLEPPITILLMLTTQRTSTVLSIPALDLNARVESLEEGYSGGGVLTNKKIVNFGDSIFGNYRDTSEADKSISKMISERTGAEVYNAGFGGCRMATHSNFWDAFSMHSLADSVASGDWSRQDQALIDGAGTLPSYFSETLSMLKTIVWSDVDIVTIGYGTNDYSGNIFIEYNAAFKEWDYFKGALKYSIAKILSAHQHIKIVVLSPMWRWFLSDGVYSYDSDDAELSKNTRGHILPDYVSACEEISRDCHVLYLDNYYSLGINKYNYLEYFLPTDGTHPNLNGRKARANCISGTMISKF